MVKNSLKFSLADINLIKQYEEKINDEAASGEIGYYHLPDLGDEIIKDASEFLKERKFTDLVLIGIGGSSLGVKAIFRMLSSTPSDLKIHFLDNLDSFTYSKLLKLIKFENALFIISSKSGTTIETITLFKCIIRDFDVKNFSQNFIFITDTGSKLEKFAATKNAKVINIPDNVGGRFSVLSAVGLVPVIAGGYDAEALLNGARACRDEYLYGKNDTILQKAYHYATHRYAKINVIFSYCNSLRYFNEWYVQLWAESLGKKRGFKRVGLTPVSLIGSRDQHSFLQLIMDGIKDKTVTFIKVKDQKFVINVPNFELEFLESCDYANGFTLNEIINAQCDATMKALLNENLSIDIIEIDQLDEFHVGYLIYYYELLTSFTGSMLGINTYDQPGVESGKLILKTMLDSKR